METLRFLFISTHFPPYHLGGDAVMVNYLSRELLRRGHLVDIVFNPHAFRLVRGEDRELARLEAKGEPTLHAYESLGGRLGVIANLSLNISLSARRKLTELVRNLRPDVVHWHNTKGFINRPLAFPGVTSLYTAHDYFAVCPRSNLQRPDLSFCKTPKLCQLCLLRWHKPPQLWRIDGRRVIRVSPETIVISPSEFVANRLKDDGIHVHKILRNFVPDAGSGPKQVGRELCALVYVGMLEPHKGPQTLLEAFSRARDKQGFRLHIVGEGSLKDSLRKRVEELGLGNRVDVPGFLPDSELRTLLNGAAAKVVPSEWPENAPLTVLEAFSLGVPVIGSNMGGLPEILTADTGSIVYEAKDVQALARTITSLWEERSVLGARGRKARSAYEQRFSPSTHINEYLQTVRSVPRTESA